jgi:hypothetical protein
MLVLRFCTLITGGQGKVPFFYKREAEVYSNAFTCAKPEAVYTGLEEEL